MRILEIGPEQQKQVDDVVAFASKPENRYRPGRSQYIPGDKQGHVCKLNDYRCVFTVTEMDGALWRHLSISVPSERYPHAAAAFMIARMFGFTGWDGETCTRLPDGWLGSVNEREHCIVLVQPVEGQKSQA